MTDNNPSMPDKIIIESDIPISEDEKLKDDDELSISNKPLEESQVQKNEIDSINLEDNQENAALPQPNNPTPNLQNPNIERYFLHI